MQKMTPLKLHGVAPQTTMTLDLLSAQCTNGTGSAKLK
jgi:hypothetical protein